MLSGECRPFPHHGVISSLALALSTPSPKLPDLFGIYSTTRGQYWFQMQNEGQEAQFIDCRGKEELEVASIETEHSILRTGLNNVVVVTR